jgi:hypothetical protein
MLSVAMLNVIMLCVVILNVTMLCVIMLNVIMLSLVILICRNADSRNTECHYAEFCGAQ